MHQPIDPNEIARRNPRPSLHYEAIARPIEDVRLTARQVGAIAVLLTIGIVALAAALIATWGRP